MARVSTISVRERLDHLSAEFSRLSGDGKVLTETGVFVQSLLQLVEILVAIFMEMALLIMVHGNSGLACQS